MFGRNRPNSNATRPNLVETAQTAMHRPQNWPNSDQIWLVSAGSARICANLARFGTSLVDFWPMWAEIGPNDQVQDDVAQDLATKPRLSQMSAQAREHPHKRLWYICVSFQRYVIDQQATWAICRHAERRRASARGASAASGPALASPRRSRAPREIHVRALIVGGAPAA